MDQIGPVGGNFLGHAVPGVLLFGWAFIWGLGFVRSGGPAAAGSLLERGLVLPVLKVVLPAIPLVVEIPPAEGWPDWAYTMNIQHVTMYAGFILTGVIDLLAVRGILPAWSTRVAFAGASLNVGFLFWGHGHTPGVPGVVHLLLALLFGLTALAALAELRHPKLAWLRVGALLTTGSWFVVIGWILYRSGWDLAAHHRVQWSYLAFSWNTMAVALLTAVFVARAGSPKAP